MNLTVLGAGAWGTALAVSIAARQSTFLWARDPAQAVMMRATRRNARYLSGVPLPPSLRLGADLPLALDHAAGGLLIVATPMSGLDDVLHRLVDSGSAGDDGPAVLWLCKGFEDGTGRLAHEVADAVHPGLRCGVLSGPSFAIEVARGQPTALVVAGNDNGLCEQAVDALHGDNLRIYTSSDLIGVEVGGAVKNVLAIATGIVDGMNLGLNARAALVTRGLAEMARLGVALGGRVETFMGLSGLGDLVLTATGDLSRNRRVGMLLAQGLPLDRILGQLGHVAEGVSSAPMLLRRARAHGVDMPITQAVTAVLCAAMTPAQALEQLMGRRARPEAR